MGRSGGRVDRARRPVRDGDAGGGTAPDRIDTVELLTDVIESLRAGDQQGYDDAVDELIDGGHWHPTAGWDAVDEGLLSHVWLLLDAPGIEPLLMAFDQVALERELIADLPDGVMTRPGALRRGARTARQPARRGRLRPAPVDGLADLIAGVPDDLAPPLGPMEPTAGLPPVGALPLDQGVPADAAPTGATPATGAATASPAPDGALVAPTEATGPAPVQPVDPVDQPTVDDRSASADADGSGPTTRRPSANASAPPSSGRSCGSPTAGRSR